MELKELGEQGPWCLKIKLGRRKMDPVLDVNFARTRVWIKYRTLLVQGTYLEDVPFGATGKKEGVILAAKEWGEKLYLMRFHEGWKESDYFEAAENLKQEIKNNG